MQCKWSILVSSGLMLLTSSCLYAHDPIFGIGPHVLFKDGIEFAIDLSQEKSSAENETELGVEIVYGITGDWAAGFEIPYAIKDEGVESSNGIADVQLFSKYRFWRQDSLGLQESAAITLGLNLDNGDDTTEPPLGNGAIDYMLGLTYGYEGLKWYRWASVRNLQPGKSSSGKQKGNKWLIDFVAGWRPVPPMYRKPDAVWLIEFNIEIADKSRKLDGSLNADSGGIEYFISPGLFWTTRNFAIKTGIQLPIKNDLNGDQAGSDYRFKAAFEWHL